MVEAAPNEATVPQPRAADQGVPDDGDLIRLEAPSDEPQPERRPRALKVTLIVLTVAALTLAATVGPMIWRMLQQQNATLTMPQTVGDLHRDDTDQAKATAADLLSALRAEIDLDESAAAIYSSPSSGAGRSIMLFGGTTTLWNPERELDTVLRLAEDDGDPIRDLQPVDPGPLGGHMKCGATGASSAPMAVCGWADHGSIALALFPDRPTTDAANLMRTLRAATLSR